MIKKPIALIAFIIILFSTNVFALETYNRYNIPVDIDINGDFIKCENKPVIIDGTTYIPLRAFSDAIGGVIEWDAVNNAATMKKDSHTFLFYLKKDLCVVDGINKNYKSIMYNNLTFIPVRIVSEALGYGVVWDDFNIVVKIYADGINVLEDFKDKSYSYDDIMYLGKIIWVESGYAHFDVKLGVGGAIINRVKSSSFPSNVKNVIFDTNYGVQFPPAHTIRINETPSYESIVAAKCVLNGVNIVGNSLYFIEKRNAESSWAHRNRPFFGNIHDMCFYE